MHGLEGMAAGAGFGEVAESGEETGAEEEKDDREIPEDGEEIEAVAGAGVGDGLLVFFGREVVGGRGVLCGGVGTDWESVWFDEARCICYGNGLLGERVSSGDPLRARANDKQDKPEEAGPEADGCEGAHGKSIAVGWRSKAMAGMICR